MEPNGTILIYSGRHSCGYLVTGNDNINLIKSRLSWTSGNRTAI